MRRFFRREKKARGGDFCEEREREAEVHSGHIIPAIRREEEEGGGAGKLSLIKARSPSPGSSLDRLIRRIFFSFFFFFK